MSLNQTIMFADRISIITSNKNVESLYIEIERVFSDASHWFTDSSLQLNKLKKKQNNATTLLN